MTFSQIMLMANKKCKISLQKFCKINNRILSLTCQLNSIVAHRALTLLLSIILMDYVDEQS